MKKAIVLIISISIMLACVLSGCSSNITEPDSTEATVTVQDHNGDTVTLPADIERIAVCDILPLPSVLSVFFNSADKIVAMSPSSMSAAENGLLCKLYPEILDADTAAVKGTDINTEELMKLDPQVVFYNASSVQLGDKLKTAGFNAIAVSVNKWDYNAVETLNQWLKLLSEIFPEYDEKRSELVRKKSEEVQKLISERTKTLSEAEREKIFFLYQYSNDSIVTSGQNFFGQWWADAIGAINVSGELKQDNSVKVTLEQVYSWDPEMILMTNFTTAYPDDLYNNTVGSFDWSEISAVKNKKAFKMPLGMYRSYTPGIDTPITLLWLARTVYPDLFSDIDITAETVDYYENVFGIRLTSEQAESIFSPSENAGKTDF